jgi:hypothetical protein
MNLSRAARRPSIATFGLIALLALVASVLFGAGGAGAAAKKTVKYVGSAPEAKMTLEGPSSGKGYPKNFTMKVTGTSQCGIGGGVKKPLPFTYELKERVYPISAGHGEFPGFELNREEGGVQGANPEFPGPETDIFIRGVFLKHGKTATVNFTHEVPVKGAEVGSTEAEVSCGFKGVFKLTRVK